MQRQRQSFEKNRLNVFKETTFSVEETTKTRRHDIEMYASVIIG